MTTTVSLHTPRPARTGSIIGIALVLVVAAAAIGRFLTTSGPAPVAPATGALPADPIAALEARTTADPSDATAWHQLASAYVADAATTGDPVRYAQADQALDRAEALAPPDPEVVAARAGLLVALHEFDDAYGLISSIEVSKRSLAAMAVVIDAATETGRYDEALTATQSLLDRRPDATALARASYQRELRGDLDGAADLMVAAERAAGSSAERAFIAALVGDIELARNDVDGAAAAYARALAVNPDLVTAQLGMARSVAAAGGLDNAITTVSAMVARSPQPAVAVLHGELLEIAGRDDEAANAFELAAANDQVLSSAGVVVDLESALFHADHGRVETAVAAGRAAYEARRTVFTADAYAWAAFVGGDLARAESLVAEALSLGGVGAPLRVHAALIAQASGRTADARTHLAVAFESSPWTAISVWDEALDLAARLRIAPRAAWVR